MSRWGWTLAAMALLSGGCHLADAPARPAARPVERQPTVGPLRPAVPAMADLPADAEFWRMSRAPEIVKVGQTAFSSFSCRTCHGFALTGGVAPNLLDQGWLHGGTPREVYGTITRGVPSKGMPTWGPVLEPKMVGSLVAYIFSFHREGEPIEVQASFTPFTPSYDLGAK
ncbi:MAG: cytochrome c [Opitutus sp.]|nr:cytochrome c [Opitutus sp.]